MLSVYFPYIEVNETFKYAIGITVFIIDHVLYCTIFDVVKQLKYRCKFYPTNIKNCQLLHIIQSVIVSFWFQIWKRYLSQQVYISKIRDQTNQIHTIWISIQNYHNCINQLTFTKEQHVSYYIH